MTRATPHGAAIVLLLGASHAAATPPPLQPPGRPRVCLALSGGGARGGAHIGVLRAFERMHIPVDCIAGTSMGSIVGGLFAAGLNPEAVHNELLAVNWTDIMEDRPPRQDLPFRRKQDIASEFINLEMGLNGGKLNIPSGLISGRKIDYLLEKITLDTKDLQSFDDLPTPFRSVTTDIGVGEMVVLSGGHLPTAIKASMNIPGAFAPVSWEGRQLVDGGLVRNLPVDVARSMSADVVIAVDVSTPLKDPNSIKTLADVAGQMSGMLTRENVGEQLKAADILIIPDLVDFSTNDYDRMEDAVARGEEAALAKSTELQRYALSESDYDAWLQARRRASKPPPVIDAVRVEGLQRVDPRIVDRKLRVQTGQPLDLRSLDQDLSRLYGLGDFQNVGFQVQEKEGENELVIKTHEKPWGPGYLRFGLNFNVDLEGTSEFRIVARWNRTRINRLGAEWRNDIEIGETRQVISEFYQPLDFSGTWFVAGGGRIAYSIDDIYDGNDKIAEYKTYEPALAAMVGAQLSRFGEIRLGVARGLVRARPTVGDVNLPVVDEPTGAWVGRIVIDRLNETDFPTKGIYFRLGTHLSRRKLGADFSYDKLAGEVVQVLTRGRYTVFMGMEGGTNLGTEIPFFDQFAVGGLLSLSGFSEQQLRGQVFGVARVGYYRAQGKLSGLFGTRVFMGGWLEAGNAWESFSNLGDDGAHYTATVSLSARTLMGPLYVAYGYATEGHGAVYITMGRSFGGRGAFDIGLN